MENEKIKSLYEIRMEEIQMMKNAIENQIKLSKSNAFKGNLIERKKKSDELKMVLKQYKDSCAGAILKEIYN